MLQSARRGTFPLHFCRIDGRTRRIVDLPGPPIGNHLDIMAHQKQERNRKNNAEWNNTLDLDVEVKVAPASQPSVLVGPKPSNTLEEQEAQRINFAARLAALAVLGKAKIPVHKLRYAECYACRLCQRRRSNQAPCVRVTGGLRDRSRRSFFRHSA